MELTCRQNPAFTASRLLLTITAVAGEESLRFVGRIRAIFSKCDAVKIDLNWQDKQGKTPLFYAVEYGHLKVVQLFLDRGSDIMVENNNGWTALHTAVNADRLEVVELILAHPRVVPQKQKLVDAADRSRRTALHIASFKSKEGDMVTLLLRNGADANAQDASGNTGMKLAEKTGRRKSKELLAAVPSVAPPVALAALSADISGGADTERA